jgi:hypothetical protein
MSKVDQRGDGIESTQTRLRERFPFNCPREARHGVFLVYVASVFRHLKQEESQGSDRVRVRRMC